MNTAKFCIKHRVTTLLAVIMVAIFGLVFTTRLQMALLPNIEAPMAVVVSYYNGATPEDMESMDIGPATAELYANEVKNAKTVVWNGPMGVFENPTLAKGTLTVAKALADADAITIIGGGDSAAAVNTLGFGDKMSHISTGGGASLEFLEGKELPGIAAMSDK